MTSPAKPALVVHDLTVDIFGERTVRPVDKVGFSVDEGQTLALLSPIFLRMGWGGLRSQP